MAAKSTIEKSLNLCKLTLMDITKIEVKNLPESEVEITGELSAEEFEGFYSQAIKEFNRTMKRDGFRPGAIPEDIIIKEVGEQVVMEQMAELALQHFYPEIVSGKSLKVVGRPEVSITKIARNNPLGFKIKTAVLPEMKLPDYKAISQKVNAKKEEVVVKDEDVAKTLEYLQKARAEKNDKGEEVLPEINDEFAKAAGNFENVEALKKAIYENMVAEKQAKNKQKSRLEILDLIIADTKMELPKSLIEAEKRRMLEEMKANIAQMNLKWDDYLSNLKKTEEEIMQGWEEDAKKRIKFELILHEIAEEEKIEVPQEELDKEVDKLIEHYKLAGESQIDRGRAQDYLWNLMRNEEVFHLLEKQ